MVDSAHTVIMPVSTVKSQDMKTALKFIALGCCAAALTLSSCDKKGNGNSTTSGVATMVCDKSFENIISQEIIVFENIYPKAKIGCQYVSQNEALNRLLSGDTRMAVVGRDLTENELNVLKADPKTKNVRSMMVAVDAAALIVNENNPVSNLSVKEIERILKGEVTNWKDVDPDAPNVAIHVVVDDPASGMTEYMRDKLMHGASFDKSTVVTADSISGVFECVKNNRGYIGVIGVSWLTADLHEQKSAQELAATLNDTVAVQGAEINERMNNSGVKVLGVMHDSLTPYRPTQENIYSGDYPLTRPIYMITTASPKGPLGGFYSFVTGVDGQRLMMHTGVMPARVQVQVYEVN